MSQEKDFKENNKTKTAARKKKNSQELRNLLYRMVYGEGFSIKDAAESLEINYSSARRIISEMKQKEDDDNGEKEDGKYVVSTNGRKKKYQQNSLKMY
jgi:transposase